jgi:hypothetical protein
LVQVSRAENVFQIMYLVRVWCLSRLSRVIKNNIARSMEIIHPPTCQFHRAVGALGAWHLACPQAVDGEPFPKRG